MEPLILATGILIGGALNSGHTTVTHSHVHDRYCPSSHFHVSYRYRSPRPYYRSHVKPIKYRRRHYRHHYSPRPIRRTKVYNRYGATPKYHKKRTTRIRRM